MRLLAAILYLKCSLLAIGPTMAFNTWCDFEDYNSSASGSGDLPIFRGSSQCVELDTSGISLLHGECTRFLANRCYLYIDGKTDFDHINHKIDTILQSIDMIVQQGEEEEVKWCGDMFLALTCNLVYPGCNPETNEVIGLCKETCLEYASRSNCVPIFSEIVDAFNEKNGKSSDNDSHFNCSTLPYFMGTHDMDNECYEDITGVIVPEASTAAATNQETVSFEDNSEDPSPFLLTYALPSTSAVVGSIIIVGVVLLSGWYLRRLRRRRCRCVREPMWSNTHGNDFPYSTTMEEVYMNHYTLHLSIEADSLESSESVDGSQAMEMTSLQTNSTLTTGERVAGSTDVFHLDLEDWKLLREGVLIPFENVIITGQLGEGAFGCVVKGLLKDKRENGREYHIPVAMKTLKNCASYDEMRGLLVESSLMHSFSHAHILGLLGLCLDPQSGAPYLVMPYMEHGDLRKFLRKKSGNNDGTTYPLGLNHDLLSRMCCDVAQGMEYLAEKRLVHRDLAARNCMVDRHLRVKVADFGLTREIYQQDCYRQSSHGQLPIKWMSPESLAYRISNEKTDVWSFGITCWEVFSLGALPYPTTENRDLLDWLEHGNRLSKPHLCNQHMYDIMQLCWILEPNERPTFTEIVTLLNTSTTDTITTTVATPSRLQRSCVVIDGHVTHGTDEEYIEMCLNDSKKAIINRDYENAVVQKHYVNEHMGASSGVPGVTKLKASLTTVPQYDTLHHNDTSVLINHAATLTSQDEEADGTSGGDRKRNTSTVVGEHTDSDDKSKNKEGLLDSIVRYFMERTSRDSSRTSDIDGPLLALQIQEIERKYEDTNSQQSNVLETQPVGTTSLIQNHTQSAAGKCKQQVLTSVPVADPVYANPYNHLYDECPTTPNVTIAFKTGERVTPADTVFAFSPNSERNTERRRSQQTQNKHVMKKSAAAMASDNSSVAQTRDLEQQKKKISVASMPDGARPDTSGETSSSWRERMRVRLLSYSAGDYVRMKPAHELDEHHSV